MSSGNDPPEVMNRFEQLKENAMNTLNTTRNRKLLVLALLAGFAAHAQTSLAAAPVADTQSSVSAVLAGTHTDRGFRDAGTPGHARDFYESTRRVLLGTNSSHDNSVTTSSTASNEDPSNGSNGQSSVDAQKLTQQVVLGRTAS
jgi:hypothetical protein